MNEIEKAIKHFENMRDENIAVLNTGFGNKPNEHNTLYANRKLYADLAIQALQEKQERDKLKCESCAFHHEAYYEDEGKRPYIKHGCTFFNRQIHLGSFCSYFEPKE